jgi:hypothetical protein
MVTHNLSRYVGGHVTRWGNPQCAASPRRVISHLAWRGAYWSEQRESAGSYPKAWRLYSQRFCEGGGRDKRHRRKGPVPLCLTESLAFLILVCQPNASEDGVDAQEKETVAGILAAAGENVFSEHDQTKLKPVGQTGGKGTFLYAREAQSSRGVTRGKRNVAKKITRGKRNVAGKNPPKSDQERVWHVEKKGNGEGSRL